jgi:hypothetical protein
MVFSYLLQQLISRFVFLVFLPEGCSRSCHFGLHALVICIDLEDLLPAMQVIDHLYST